MQPFRTITTQLLIAATLMACTRTLPALDTGSPATALHGTYWRLTELNGRPAAPGIREAHIRLTAEGERLGGSTGCNSVSGTYTLTGDRLRFPGPLTTTRMACTDPALSAQERAFLDALAAAERFTVAGAGLVLYQGPRPLARFEAGAPR